MRNDLGHLLTVLFNIAVIAAGVGALAYLMVAAFSRGAGYE